MTNEELEQAWARVLSDRAVAGDGMRIAMWLRREQLKVTPQGWPACAVHDSEGARRLASQILGFVPEATDDASE